MPKGKLKGEKKETPKAKTITIDLGGGFVANISAAKFKQIPLGKYAMPPKKTGNKKKDKEAEKQYYVDLAKYCDAEVYYVTTTKKGVQKWAPATDESHYAKAGRAIKSKSDAEVKKKVKKVPPAV